MTACTRCDGTGIEPSNELALIGVDLSNGATRFESFWERYPRKQGRKVAEQRWRRMTEVERRLALHALPTHCRMWRHEGRGTRTIPMASTWLNQERWLDDLTDYVDPSPAAEARPMPGRAGIERVLADRRMSLDAAERILGVDDLAPRGEIERAYAEIIDRCPDALARQRATAARDRLIGDESNEVPR